MKTVIRALGTAAAVTALVGAAALAPSVPAYAAGSCAANHFCAFDGRATGGAKLLDSATTANTTVDVADNRVASAINNQGRRWCGVNVEAGQNRIRATIPARTTNADFSPYNDKVDFFWAGTAGGCS